MRTSSRGSVGSLLHHPPIGPPLVSARSWAVTNSLTGQLLAGSSEDEVRDVASLTKILTCYTCLKLAKRYPAITLDLNFKVSSRAAGMPGTRAALLPGDELSVKNLLYGLMLPSGNDAATCLAEGIGAILVQTKGLNQKEHSSEAVFVSEMNAFAESLGLEKSKFRNPTGLMGGKSTAQEINLLATHAMRLGIFRTIVRSYEHCVGVRGSSGVRRELRWLNTNKLLEAGFDGLKTGTTLQAGACLTASLHSNGVHLVVTTLHCSSSEARWGEVRALAAWAQTRCR